MYHIFKGLSVFAKIGLAIRNSEQWIGNNLPLKMKPTPRMDDDSVSILKNRSRSLDDFIGYRPLPPGTQVQAQQEPPRVYKITTLEDLNLLDDKTFQSLDRIDFALENGEYVNPKAQELVGLLLKERKEEIKKGSF